MNKIRIINITVTLLFFILFISSGCNLYQTTPSITVLASMTPILSSALTVTADNVQFTPTLVVTPIPKGSTVSLPSPTPSDISLTPIPPVSQEVTASVASESTVIANTQLELNPQGIILYLENDQLWQLDITTHETKQLTFDEGKKKMVFSAAWAPDGQVFAYNREGKVLLSDRKGNTHREIASHPITLWWVNSTILGYCQDTGAGFENPCFLFDTISNTTAELQTANYGKFAYSPDLTKVFVQEVDTSGQYPQPQPSLYILDLTTKHKIFERETGIWTTDPQWTPDSRKVAFTSSLSKEDELGSEVFVVDANGENLIQLTNFFQEKDTHITPAFLRWSPDEEWLALVLVTPTSKKLAILKSDGTFLNRLNVEWLTLGGPNVAPVWSPDGEQIAFLSNKIDDKNDTWQIYAVNISTGDVSQLTETPGRKSWLDWK